MSNENPLSHHEQLRYDYLFKNFHYLNDRERKEFDYLQQKMTGPKQEVHPSYQEEKEETWSSDIDLPTYGNRSRAKKREKVAPLPKVKKKKRRIRFKRILTWFLLLITCVAAGMIFMFLRGFQSAANPTNKPL